MRFLVALVLLCAACDQPPVPGECAGDTYFDELKAINGKGTRYQPPACPASNRLTYEGIGCVICTYTDQCFAQFQITGCSPAPGVVCWSGKTVCPAGLSFPPDTTVKIGEF